ncbi:MAG: hypothetical protein LBL92_00400, partial [Propionibacteriaceae bacterium]|nr:hypothetical protein [Propionibacteriaceae bacterium]
SVPNNAAPAATVPTTTDSEAPVGRFVTSAALTVTAVETADRWARQQAEHLVATEFGQAGGR